MTPLYPQLEYRKATHLSCHTPTSVVGRNECNFSRNRLSSNSTTPTDGWKGHPCARHCNSLNAT